MTPMQISFEQATTPQTFAHVRSSDGLLGHAAELRSRIPVGTWLTLAPDQDRVSGWLVKKCGFRFHGIVKTGEEWHMLLRRED